MCCECASLCYIAMFSPCTALLKTSERNGPTELPEVDDPEEECRNDDLPPDFLCHGAGICSLLVSLLGRRHLLLLSLLAVLHH